MTVEQIEVGQYWQGHGICTGMGLDIIAVPRAPTPLEIRLRSGEGGAYVVPADGSPPHLSVTSMTRTWLRRFYHHRPDLEGRPS